MTKKFKTISIIRRRIKDSYEYKDFREQWLPEVIDQYNVPTYVISALKVGNPKEVLSLALIDADLEKIYKESERTKKLDINRKDKIVEVADSQGVPELFLIQDFDKLYDLSPSCTIRLLEVRDIPVIVDAFLKANWPKPASIFETYLQEQLHYKRLAWVAHINDQFTGYVTLKWQSEYEPFVTGSIPEIMDLNVLPPFRKTGVGSKLLEAAEKEAATKSDVVGLGVGLYGGADGGYGAAQKLYVNRGYIPDGKGATYSYQLAIPGYSYALDDELILWFTKKLKDMA